MVRSVWIAYQGLLLCSLMKKRLYWFSIFWRWLKVALDCQGKISWQWCIKWLIGKKHPFKDDAAGRGCFKRRHPQLTLRTPQPLSYCHGRAATTNSSVGTCGRSDNQENTSAVTIYPELIVPLSDIVRSIKHAYEQGVRMKLRHKVSDKDSSEEGEWGCNRWLLCQVCMGD